MTDRFTATVRWFDNAKGYGFLDTAAGDVLVHHSDIVAPPNKYRTLATGDQVEYLPVKTDRGIAAKEVVRLDSTDKVPSDYWQRVSEKTAPS